MDDLRNQLKELRLMKDQSMSRFCMGCLLVALRLCRGPALLLLVCAVPGPQQISPSEWISLIATAVSTLK